MMLSNWPSCGLLDDRVLILIFYRVDNTAQDESKFETIINDLPCVNLSESGGVTGWRVENGICSTPRLYLRKHLLDKKQELDKFMDDVSEGCKTRLYVTGPPGSGKTSFFLLYFAQWAKERQNTTGLVVQYRHSTVCDIMIIESSQVKRISPPTSADGLLATFEAGGKIS